MMLKIEFLNLRRSGKPEGLRRNNLIKLKNQKEERKDS